MNSGQADKTVFLDRGVENTVNLQLNMKSYQENRLGGSILLTIKKCSALSWVTNEEEFSIWRL